MVIGNAAGLAIAVSGLMTDQVAPELQHLPLTSAWFFFVGLMASVLVNAAYHAYTSDEAHHFRLLAHTLQDGTLPPQRKPRRFPFLVAMTFVASVLGFVIGIAAPLWSMTSAYVQTTELFTPDI